MGGDISKGMRWLKRRSNKVAPFVPATTTDASTEYSPKSFSETDEQQVEDDTKNLKKMHSSTDSLLSMLLGTDPEDWDESLAKSSSLMASTNRSQRRRGEQCSSLYDSGFNSSSTSTAFDASAYEYHIPTPEPVYDIYDFSSPPPPPQGRPKASHGVRQGPRVVPVQPPPPKRRRKPTPPPRMAPMRVYINYRPSYAEVLRCEKAAEMLRKEREAEKLRKGKK